MADLQTEKQEVFDYIHAFLGGGMIDVELDPIHYETALSKALSKFRQKSENSVEESYITLDLVKDQNHYTLHYGKQKMHQEHWLGDLSVLHLHFYTYSKMYYF